MKPFLRATLVLGLFLPTSPVHSADRKAEVMEGLKELHELIGGWKGTGGPDKIQPAPGDPLWSERLRWGWRFGKDDAWLVVKVDRGKYLKGGELRYLPDRERYQFTAHTIDGARQVFEGKYRNSSLTLERRDAKSKEMQQLKMTIAGDGVRFIYRFARKRAGSTLWRKEYMVACTKEGESLAAREKMIECVVTGGLGTMPVSYKGATYYVCCSGCADAFRDNPEKYIAEYNARRKKR